MKPANVMQASAAFCGRAVLRLIRMPEVIIQTVIFPVILLTTNLAVFSAAVELYDDSGPYAQRLVPGLVVAGVMFGSTGSAMGLFGDIKSGFMQRIRALSTPLAAPIVGIALAEALRGLLATAALTAAGYLAGFRFHGGVGHFVGFVVVAAVSALAFPWIGLWLATKARSVESFLAPLSAFFLVLLFMSQSVVPLSAYPEFVQPFVRWNPGSAFVVALDSLARGQDATSEIVLAAVWSVVMIGVFGALAVRGLRTHRQG